MPVDLALLDALAFKVVQQALGQEGQQGCRQTMRFLVLEAIVAGHIAFRGRKKNNAENSATHHALRSDRVSGLQDTTRQISSHLIRRRLNV